MAVRLTLVAVLATIPQICSAHASSSNNSTHDCPTDSLVSSSELSVTCGALVFSLVLAAMMMGATNLQVYFFYTTYKRDTLLQKISVGCLWVLDVLQLALVTHVAYYYLVQRFGDLLELSIVVWSVKAQHAVQSLVTVMVQTLYLRRLIILDANEHRALPWLLGIFIPASYGVAILQNVQVFRLRTYKEVETLIAWSTYITLASVTFMDLAIALALVWLLMRRRTGQKSTDSALNAIIVYTFSTGLLTSMCSMATLIIWTLMPLNLIFLALQFIVSKLYVSSYMAMLNARKHFRSKMEAVSIIPIADVAVQQYQPELCSIIEDC